MANTPTLFYRGSPGTTSATLATVPASTTWIVTNVIVTNTSLTTSSNITLLFNGFEVLYEFTVAPTGIFALDCAQVISASQLITGLQSVNAILDVHISGVAR